ncbi:N-6 DNA methylase [Mesorhizobium sp. M0968]|uniref:N-6 DNA methylase n=1 Tax=Mesorhizobium sp. M0968 TaxID=2957037 RepID=UPI00333AA665
MNRAIKIAESVLAVLSAATFDGPRLMLPGQLDRPDYVAVNKVLEANGGKWNRTAKAHVFPGESAEEAVEQAIATGEFRRVKQDLGQFDTPAPIVALVIKVAEIEPGMTALEPSAGIGNLAVGAIALGAVVHTCELDPRRAAELTMRIGNLTAPAAEHCMGRHGDFLALQPGDEPAFDRIIMNPPFAPGQADIDHVMHAAKFLKPGGRLVSVMSAGVLFRSNAKTVAFRDFVDARGGSIERLPDGSFEASGTSVNTCIVVIPGAGA